METPSIRPSVMTFFCCQCADEINYFLLFFLRSREMFRPLHRRAPVLVSVLCLGLEIPSGYMLPGRISGTLPSHVVSSKIECENNYFDFFRVIYDVRRMINKRGSEGDNIK